MQSNERLQMQVREASPKQVAFISALAVKRQITAEDRQYVDAFMAAATQSMSAASLIIDRLLSRPYAQATPASDPQTITPGVYETPNGEVYIVKSNRAKTRNYAKRLREVAGERLAESGEHVNIEFDYAPGAIYRLTNDMRMPLDRAKALTIRYGKCIVCGRHLKDATSVERGIGPVCAKAFC